MIFYRKYTETHRSLFFFYQNKDFSPGRCHFVMPSPNSGNIRRSKIVGFSDIS